MTPFFPTTAAMAGNPLSARVCASIAVKSWGFVVGFALSALWALAAWVIAENAKGDAKAVRKNARRLDPRGF
jgi:hypothetical protein